MRLLIHDYGGYPFILQLSQELARRGHSVDHVWFAGLAKAEAPTDGGVNVHEVRAGIDRDRYALVSRIRHEMEYAAAVATIIRGKRPDVVLSGNAPLLASERIRVATSKVGAAYIHWLQDIHGKALRAHAVDRLGAVGLFVGRAPEGIERRLLRKSDAVVAISEGFAELAESWGVEASRVAVIENWAEPIPEMPRDNAWAQRYGLVDKSVILYAGTLGLKHDVDLLLTLASSLQQRANACLVVVAHGPGRQKLADASQRLGIGDGELLILDKQPYVDLPSVLATADLLLVAIHPDASRYSVPSKVLTYMAAGRPILASMPTENPAARRIRETACGIVVPPDDAGGVVAAATNLIDDAHLRSAMSTRARAFADHAFAITAIADRFEALFARSGERASAR